MKKILLLFATIIVGINVQAQSLWDSSKPDQTFTFGVRAGINFASSTEHEATSTRTGVHFGVSADYNIIKSFSISSGVFFVTKGFKGNFPEIELANPTKQTASSLSASSEASGRFFCAERSDCRAVFSACIVPPSSEPSMISDARNRSCFISSAWSRISDSCSSCSYSPSVSRAFSMPSSWNSR